MEVVQQQINLPYLCGLKEEVLIQVECSQQLVDQVMYTLDLMLVVLLNGQVMEVMQVQQDILPQIDCFEILVLGIILLYDLILIFPAGIDTIG